MNTQPTETLRIKEVCQMLQIAERTLHRHIRSGEVPAPMRIGRAMRWSRKHFMDWFNAKAAG